MTKHTKITFANDVDSVIRSLAARGYTIISANLVANDLYPAARQNNSKGQTFNLASGVTGRLLRKSKLVIEVTTRQWEIIKERI